jgi:hypothetical protein
MGSIGKNQHAQMPGLFFHSAQIFTVQGVPLGLVSERIWARPAKKKPDKDKRRKNQFSSLAEKESARWIDALKETIIHTPEGVKVITVADRESDFYEFIHTADQLHAAFLIRNSWNRKLMRDTDAHGDAQYIDDMLAATAPAGAITLDLPARAGQAARQAKVEITFCRVTLQPSDRRKDAKPKVPFQPVTVNIVSAQEVAAPKGVEAIDWVLLTSEAVESFDDAVRMLTWYKLRWGIEIYHKFLKSGCRVEDCRLETGERLMRYVAVMSVIAYRLFQLTMQSRAMPEAPCTELLSEAEWQALYCKKFKTTKLPPQPPTMREAARWIAQLGGFLGRKHDGDPGPTALWRGWQILAQCVDIWQVCRPTS